MTALAGLSVVVTPACAIAAAFWTFASALMTVLTAMPPRPPDVFELLFGISGGSRGGLFR